MGYFREGGHSLVSFLRGLFQEESDGWFGTARGLEALDLGAEMRCGLWLSSENMKSSALLRLMCCLALRPRPSVFW